MIMKKSFVLFLTFCLMLCLFAPAVSAADGDGVFGTSMSVGVFVSLIIAAVLLIVVAVLCILKREKLAEALKAYKSEMKKITWYSWKNVVRGTVFVVVSVLVIGVVVGLLDIVFFELQYLATGSGFSFFGG
jgi:preprotein translocase SecE subunit